MSELLLAILFILFLILAAGVVWAWFKVHARLKTQDERLAESLDDLDLVEFQESVTQLLDALKRSGEQLVRQAEEKTRSIQSLTEKTKDIEKRLAQRLAQYEKQLIKAEQLYSKLEARIPAKPRVEEVKEPEAPKKPKPAPARQTAPSIPKRLPAKQLSGTLPDPQDLPLAKQPPAPMTEPLPEPEPGLLAAPLTKQGKYAHVQAMAEQGLSTEQIARQAHLLPGEVELILRLNRKR